jgi:hypothetical protein
MKTSPHVTEIIKPPWQEYGAWHICVMVNYSGVPMPRTLTFRTESEASEIKRGYEIES